jgi:hypothetical protein
MTAPVGDSNHGSNAKVVNAREAVAEIKKGSLGLSIPPSGRARNSPRITSSNG